MCSARTWRICELAVSRRQHCRPPRKPPPAPPSAARCALHSVAPGDSLRSSPEPCLASLDRTPLPRSSAYVAGDGSSGRPLPESHPCGSGSVFARWIVQRPSRGGRSPLKAGGTTTAHSARWTSTGWDWKGASKRFARSNFAVGSSGRMGSPGFDTYSYRSSIGTHSASSAPMYRPRGRISRLSSWYSKTCPTQPPTRLIAKMGVYISTGMPSW